LIDKVTSKDEDYKMVNIYMGEIDLLNQVTYYLTGFSMVEIARVAFTVSSEWYCLCPEDCGYPADERRDAITANLSHM
jgi:hypothetical protein